MDTPRPQPGDDLDPQAAPDYPAAPAAPYEGPYAPPTPAGPPPGSGPYQPPAPYGPQPHHGQTPYQPQAQAGAGWGYAPPGAIVVEGVNMLPAGFLPRLGAFLIDMAFLSLLSAMLIQLAGIPQPTPEEVSHAFSQFMRNMDVTKLSEAVEPPTYQAFLMYLMYAAYFTFFHAFMGATLGKLALGLQVRRQDGQPIGLGLALLRYGLYFLAAKLVYTAWWIPVDRERRTLYDVVLKLNVFRAAPRYAQPQTPAPPQTSY